MNATDGPTFLERIEAWKQETGRVPDRPHLAAVHAAPPADDLTGYVTAVCRGVATAANGTRNDTLNRAAYTLGRIVGAGQLDYHAAADALTEAGHAAGLPDTETGPTIRSGLKAGENDPRTLTQLQRTPEVTSWLSASPATAPPAAASSASTSYPMTPAGSPAPGTGPNPAATAAPTGDATTSGSADADEADLTALVHQHLPLVDWHSLWADDAQEEWIIEPLLPARRLIALFSPPKVGKSLLMLELAAAVARGTDTLGVTLDRPRRVLYVDFENDPKGDIRERLQAMGYGPDDLADLCYLSFPNLAALDSDKGSRELMAAVAVYACELVVIDTVSRAVQGEENENDTWLDFYRHTGLKLKRAGVACVRLDHTGKDVEKGMRGGSAKYGDVDAVWRMTTVVDEKTYRLDCTDHRFPVSEKTVVVHRELVPRLHHRVDAEGHRAAMRVREDAIIEALDALGVPDGAGEPTAKQALKTTGIRPGRALRGALKRRQLRLPEFLTDVP